ncbi:hypothetical protein [Streptomyces sp. NPDC059949]|uniref:hypothetical protein n=1 Tax=Streptomyces sp. NPDC059949 TaxID=3347013 RepID=UPI0036641071
MATVNVPGVGLGVYHPRGNVGSETEPAPTPAEILQERVEFGWCEAIEVSDYITDLGVVLYDREHIELFPARKEEGRGGTEHGGEGADGVDRGIGVVAPPQFGELADRAAALMPR